VYGPLLHFSIFGIFVYGPLFHFSIFNTFVYGYFYIFGYGHFLLCCYVDV